jgi:hypothetical protein
MVVSVVSLEVGMMVEPIQKVSVLEPGKKVDKQWM